MNRTLALATMASLTTVALADAPVASYAPIPARVFDDAALALGAPELFALPGASFTIRAGERRFRLLPDAATAHASVDALGVRGAVEGGGWFSLTLVGDAVAGAIWTAEGAFDLRPTGIVGPGGEITVGVVDLGAVPLPGCAGHPEAHPPADAPAIVIPAEDADNRVRVLIGVTPLASAEMGGFASARAIAVAAVDATNQAYLNSAVAGGLQIELAGFLEVLASEFGAARSLLRRITNVEDGDLDDLARAREAYNADLVALLSPRETQVCGIAWLSPGFEAFGYSITSWPCAVGNLTFAHELGHNYGCSHDAANAGNPLSDYAVGWNWDGLSGDRFRTVMSTSSSGGRRRLPHFSNPDVLVDGVATGDALDADNTRWLEETAPQLANYRQGTLDTTDCDANGQPDAVEVALDPQLDANDNGRLDACEVLDGTLLDCDANGVADLAQVSPRVFRRVPSTRVTPDGIDPVTLAGLPEAASTVEARFQAFADLSEENEHIDVFANGVFLLRLFVFDGSDCNTPGPAESIVISADFWNSLGPAVTFSFEASSEVNAELCSGDSHIGGSVSYTGIDSAADADGDGLLDACAVLPCNPADVSDPFGQLTFADISAFLGAFTGQDPAADLATPAGAWTFADISAFLAAFSAGCP